MDGKVDEIGLADAIYQLKSEFAAAQMQPAPGGIRMPVKSVTVELKVVATKAGEAKAGFKVPVIDLEFGGGGSLSNELTHTITVVFDVPVDADGNQVEMEALPD